MDNIKLQVKYSLNKFNKILYNLEKALNVDDYNQNTLVENIRNLSEFLVYAEKFSKNYFELFIECNVLEHFSRYLNANNRFVNIQLIQTMSILFQNIEDKIKIFYMFAHAFLNELISFNFDFTQDDELVDYYVSFLKSLTLKLNEETVNFFFNDKFKTFPLYHQAVKFYNHKESMVRTSVRTITLTIYNINNSKMRNLFLGLPYCSYFVNLACYLRDFWVQIDKHVVSLTQDPKQIDLMMSEAEDSNETLFYIQDIFASNDQNINRMLANALLHYAYLPTVVQSLCALKKKPQLSLNTCLYVLTQTFRIVKEQYFTNILFSSLFLPNLPKRIQEQIEEIPRNPSFYSSKFVNNHLQNLSLRQYLEEYYNLFDIDVFLSHGSQNFEFIKEIKEEYETIIKNLEIVDDSQNEESKDENSNNQSLRDEEIKIVLQGMIFSKVGESDMQRIKEEHNRLSYGLGILVGISSKNDIEKMETIVDEYDSITAAIQNGKLSEMPKSQNKEIILSFLRSKDDNLLLLVGGLIMSIQYNKSLNPEIIQHVPEICPYRLRKQSNQDEEEEEKGNPSSPHQAQMLKMMELILDKIDTDPPFRNFTMRLYAKILTDLQPPHIKLNKQQYMKLVMAYKSSIYQLKRIVYQIDPHNVLDPYYHFIENFQREITKFQQIDSNQEFNRMLAQPLLMMPYITDELQNKVPPQLHLPHIDDDQQNQTLFMQDFILKRFLVHKFTQDLDQKEPNYDTINKIDYGYVTNLKEGDVMNPIPSDKQYQICFLKTLTSNMDQMYLMLDDNFFILIKPNLQNPTHIKGTIEIMQKQKQIVETMIDTKDSRNLMIAMLNDLNPDGYVEFTMYFEDWRKCSEIKEFFIDEKKKRQQSRERDLLEKFLIEDCENEINNWLQ